MKTKRLSVVIQRWGKCALTLLLACALLAGLGISASARELYQGEVVDPVIPKPTVTVQGNLVVDKPGGKPTGFYELALCVRSGRTIVGPAPADWTTVKELTEDEYQTVLTAIENNTAPAGITGDSYTLTYYPFTSVGGAVNINTDVLTAVDWKIQNVTYAEFDATTNTYKTPAAGASPAPSTAPAAPIGSLDAGYGQGIDPAPAAQGYDPEELTQAEAFPDITTANMLLDNNPSVAIDVENDPRMFEATGQVDYYDAANKSALLTLTASAPDNAPIVLKESTPLVVARFSYDLKRFPDVKVNDTAWAGDLRNEATGEPNDVGFWLGWDKTTAIPPTGSTLPTTNLIQKTPLTWLGESDPVNLYDFTNSDLMAAHTRVNQTAWVHMVTDGAPLTQRDTYFYYYLGAMGQAGLGGDQTDGQQTLEVVVNGAPTEVPGITMPKTGGEKVLTEGTEENPSPTPGPAATPAPGASPAPSPTPTPTQAQYTYFQNLLRIQDRTMVLELVNAETFKKPSGGFGGNTILFYDWDDTLIGNLIVEDGDVREAVNNYVEQNFVHPDLRSSTVLAGTELGGNLPDFTTTPAAGSDAEKYTNLITSLDREYTYRGEYDSVYGGGAGSVTYPEKGQPGYDETKAGSSYPLTNKLDYAPYRRLNTVTTVDTQDTATGKKWTEEYYTVDDLTADPDAARYPWTYCWAVVADPLNHTLATKTDWPLMVDSAKLESTWTTFGTGELSDQAPGGGNVLTAFATPAPVTPPATNPTVTYPGGLSADWSLDPLHQTPAQYAYQTSSADANGYLRFADFSDLDAMLLPGQNVLVVKAVYEPGTHLDPLGNYTIVDGSLSMRRYSTTASTQNGVYSFAFLYQRWNDADGTTPLTGVRRVRDPAVKTSFVFDAKSVDETIDLTTQGSFFMQNLAAGDGNLLEVDLTSGGLLWNMGYNLVERYGTNFSNGANRSKPDELGNLIKKNFLYDEDDPKYDERQGTDGFVTQLTLYTLLEEASKAARNEENMLTTHVSIATIRDLNLKRAAGDPPTEYTAANASRVATYIQDLVKRLYDDGVSIDPKTGNVTLTWHQVQRHILMCEAAGGTAVPGIYSGGVLMTDAQCAGFAWCRLDDCAADVKMEINSVNDVLEAIYLIKTKPGSTDAKKAQEALYGDGSPTSTGVTAATLKGYGFRQHADGVPYDTTAGDAALKTAILSDLDAVVTALAPTLGTTPDWSTVTWEQIQEEIIKDNMTTPPATMTFWWKPETGKPNGTPPTITTWDELLKYSILDTLGADMDGDGQPDPDSNHDGVPDSLVPDAFDGFTAANVTKATLDAMIKEDVHGNATGPYANMGWLRKEVDANGEAVEFADADEFATAWTKALAALAAPAPTGGGYNTIAKLQAAPWEEIQYALLTGKYATATDIINGTVSPAYDMYWNDGGLPKLTLDKLLPALHELQSGTETKIDALLKGDIDPINSELYLRKAGGTRFASDTEFKKIASDAFMNLLIYDPTAYTKYVQADTINMTWEELQWLLIHYQDLATGAVTAMPDHATLTAPGGEGLEYWWKDGGKPTGPMNVSTLKDVALASYYYNDSESPNTHALDNLQLSQLQGFGIRATSLGGPYLSTDSQSAFITAVTKAVKKLPYTVDSVVSVDADNLALELQYLLLGGDSATYRSAAELKNAGVTYWWQASGAKLTVADREDLLQMAWMSYVEDHPVPEAKAALDAIDLELLSKGDHKGGLGIRRTANGDAYTDAMLPGFETELERAIKWFKDNQGATYDNLATTIGSYQLQYLILNATVGADYKAAETDMATDFNLTYWWKAYNDNPSGPAKEELSVKAEDWKEFTDALILQWSGSKTALPSKTAIQDLLAAKAAAGISEEDYFNKVLMLRISGDGAGGDVHEFTAGEFIAKSITPLRAALFNSNRGKKSDFFNALGTKMNVAPTWEEFQYLLLHYGDIDSSATMPSTADCAAEKKEDNYPWMYKTPGVKVEYKVPDATWKEFTDALILQWSGSKTALPSKTAIQDLLAAKAAAGISEEDYFNKVLMLRISGDGAGGDVHEFTAGEFIAKSITPLRAALFNSNRGKKSDFFNALGTKMNVAPTWEEFQYLLLHYGDIDSSATMPSTADCAAEKTQDNYSWMWVDEDYAPPAAHTSDDGIKQSTPSAPPILNLSDDAWLTANTEVLSNGTVKVNGMAQSSNGTLATIDALVAPEEGVARFNIAGTETENSLQLAANGTWTTSGAGKLDDETAVSVSLSRLPSGAVETMLGAVTPEGQAVYLPLTTTPTTQTPAEPAAPEPITPDVGRDDPGAPSTPTTDPTPDEDPTTPVTPTEPITPDEDPIPDDDPTPAEPTEDTEDPETRDEVEEPALGEEAQHGLVVMLASRIQQYLKGTVTDVTPVAPGGMPFIIGVCVGALALGGVPAVGLQIVALQPPEPRCEPGALTRKLRGWWRRMKTWVFQQLSNGWRKLKTWFPRRLSSRETREKVVIAALMILTAVSCFNAAPGAVAIYQVALQVALHRGGLL